LEKNARRVSLKDVEHMALLAHINLSKEEKKIFTEQLNQILDHFGKIDEVDTKGVKPTFNVIEVTNVFREDAPKPSLKSESALSNAPEKERGYFKTKRIV
jgi:aspartyl-tRNA(Asn)/glutamyl-tRNA(Gln) amidotransferase subunit C